MPLDAESVAKTAQGHSTAVLVPGCAVPAQALLNATLCKTEIGLGPGGSSQAQEGSYLNRLLPQRLAQAQAGFEAGARLGQAALKEGYIARRTQAMGVDGFARPASGTCIQFHPGQQSFQAITSLTQVPSAAPEFRQGGGQAQPGRYASFI